MEYTTTTSTSSGNWTYAVPTVWSEQTMRIMDKANALANDGGKEMKTGLYMGFVVYAGGPALKEVLVGPAYVVADSPERAKIEVVRKAAVADELPAEDVELTVVVLLVGYLDD